MFQKMLQGGNGGGNGGNLHILNRLNLSVHSSSGQLDSTFTADKTIDNSYATAWQNSGRGSEHWIIYKVNNPMKLSSVLICPATAASKDMTSKYKIYVSDTTTFGEPIASGDFTVNNAWNAQNPSKTFGFQLNGVDCNYIKVGVITTDSHSDLATYTSGIGEFIVYGYTD